MMLPQFHYYILLYTHQKRLEVLCILLFFVIGVVCILLVVSCVGYHHFNQQVRSEPITPRRTSKMVEENGNGTTGSTDGHYEMKSNGVLASSHPKQAYTGPAYNES